MYQSRVHRFRLILCLAAIIAVIFSIILAPEARSIKIDNANVACADVLLVFARGSSDNNQGLFTQDPFDERFSNLEEVPGAFFQAMKSNLDRDYPHITYKAVSVHNFPNLYNPKGYPAVGIFGPRTVNNIFEAEMSWWPFGGDYRDSVISGTEETVGYVKDQIALCPDQQIVMGGYSQGANVIGDSLPGFTEQERSHISAVALFGDPKYIGSNADNSTPIDYLANTSQKPIAKPWKRGTAALVDRGVLDARVSYVPSDMENKTISWCFNDDFICTGGSAVLQVLKGSPLDGYKYDKTDLSAGHKRYSVLGAPQAASEITQRLAPRLQQIELSKGGVNPNKRLAQPVPLAPNHGLVDMMFMVDVSYNLDDVLGQLRQNSYEVLGGFVPFFGDVMYGVGDYSENGDLPDARIPHTAIRQNLTSNLEGLVTAMNSRLAYGSSSGGGLDVPDPHMIGIERGITGGNWRQTATKHLVIFTDRPSLATYTYNICNGNTRIGFGIDGPSQCAPDQTLESDLVVNQSELCADIYEVLSAQSCTPRPTIPYSINNITRTLNDAVRLAQARGIAISIVVPHGYHPNSDPIATEAQLKELASSTGGLLLNYNAFTRENYTDAIWQILNLKPKVMTLSALGNFDTFGAADKLQPKATITTKAFAPTLLSISSPNIFSEYKWDFDGNGGWDETTAAPTNEHIFTAASDSTFVTVGGFTDGAEQSRVTLPLVVSPGEEPVPQLLPTLPLLPQGVAITKMLEGTIAVTWVVPESPAEQVVFVGDATTRLPIKSAPLKSGSLTITNVQDVRSDLLVWAEDLNGASEKAVVNIESDQPADIAAVSNKEPESSLPFTSAREATSVKRPKAIIALLMPSGLVLSSMIFKKPAGAARLSRPIKKLLKRFRACL